MRHGLLWLTASLALAAATKTPPARTRMVTSIESDGTDNDCAGRAEEQGT